MAKSAELAADPGLVGILDLTSSYHLLKVFLLGGMYISSREIHYQLTCGCFGLDFNLGVLTVICLLLGGCAECDFACVAFERKSLLCVYCLFCGVYF